MICKKWDDILTFAGCVILFINSDELKIGARILRLYLTNKSTGWNLIYLDAHPDDFMGILERWFEWFDELLTTKISTMKRYVSSIIKTAQKWVYSRQLDI